MIGAKLATIDTASPALEGLLARGENLAPLMERWGAALASLVQLGFISSSSPYGARWAALKLRQGQPLRNTGALMNSITYVPETDSVVIGPGFGPSSKGAALQQFGGTVKPRNGPLLRFKVGNRWYSLKQVTVPAREYLPTQAEGLPEGWAGELVSETAAYVMGNA